MRSREGAKYAGLPGEWGTHRHLVVCPMAALLWRQEGYAESCELDLRSWEGLQTSLCWALTLQMSLCSVC